MIKTLQKPQNAEVAANGFSQVYRFSVDEYHRMIDAGILTKNHRVELLDGRVVDKVRQTPPHASAVTRFNHYLLDILPVADWTHHVRGPVTLATSEPEPDISIARGHYRRFARRHPGPSDTVLVIEVADTSLISDREEKAPIYAAAKIPHYWIVNLIDGCVECHSRPQSGRRPAYRTVKILTNNDLLLLVLDGKKYGEVAISKLMS